MAENIENENMETVVEEENNKVSTGLVFKSGMWYTISTFLFRSIAFITTPIITRMLTKTQYGEYNNLQSWISFVIILVACSLQSTIIRAKLDYEDEIDSYSFSMLSLQTIITTVVFGVIFIFRQPVSDFTGIDTKYFLILFIYVIFNRTYAVFITNERAHYRYKAYSLITGLMIAITCIFTVILVMNMNDKLNAIVYGNYLPYVFVGIIMYLIIIKRGKRVDKEHFSYGLKLGIPLVPHVLSLMLLSSSDRIMITKLSGAKFTAMYSLSNVISNIVSILLGAMIEAWSPWFMDSMKAGEKKTIKKVASIYYGIFFTCILGALLLGPEVLYILGGEKYLSGKNLVPPLVAGCVVQFAYSMYVQVEFYEKKMKMVSVATSVAAVTNIGLNLILIPIFGYQAAAYTTLISYMVLLALHYSTICKMGYKDIFDRKILFGGVVITLALIPITILLYRYMIIRYIVTAIYLCGFMFVIYKNRELIKKMLFKK